MGSICSGSTISIEQMIYTQLSLICQVSLAFSESGNLFIILLSSSKRPIPSVPLSAWLKVLPSP